MPWSTIESDAILEEFSPQERSALLAIQGDSDNLPGILERVIKNARGAVEASGVTLGEAGTIPDVLESAVVDIVRWRLLTSYPQLKALQTKDRKDAHDAGTVLLKEVAKGEFKIAASGSTASPSPSPSFGDRERNFTRDSQEGL